MTDLVAAAHRLAEQTRQAQGLPVTITDPSVLRRLAVLLTARPEVTP